MPKFQHAWKSYMFHTSNQQIGIAVATSDLGSGNPNSAAYYVLCIFLGPQSYVENMEY